MLTQDTIAAIATAPGQGGVSIVRLSGPEAERVLMRVFRPAQKSLNTLTSHLLTYGRVTDGDTVVDECMAVIMRAPRSYTREDVAELQLHGGAYTCQRVLELCLSQGARLAEPGEFTRRAFLSGRIDLSQAEAVMALIAAQGEQAHQAALRQLEGGAGQFIRQAADTLYAIQAGAAACIDYPEEISDEEAVSDLAPQIEALAQEIASACDERAARLLSGGLHAALCGRPNVGKSSLLNALLGEERAIVTNIPGTTRDVVTGDTVLEGCVIHLTDTAGLRETDDPVEHIGVQLAEKALAGADAVIAVIDAALPLSDEDAALLARIDGDTATVVLNKCDLPPQTTPEEIARHAPRATVLTLSANQAASLAPLKARLASLARVSDRLALTQPRHVDAARRAVRHLHAANASLQEHGVDLCALDLHAAQLALSEITGDAVDDHLLSAIFSRFCVGK